MIARSQGLVLGIVGVVLVVGALLTVVLVPMSFSYLDYFEVSNKFFLHFKSSESLFEKYFIQAWFHKKTLYRLSQHEQGLQWWSLYDRP